MVRVFSMISGVVAAILRLFSIRKFVRSQDHACKHLLPQQYSP